MFGGHPKLNGDPHFRDLIPFHEYFHGDDGSGIGASHQTGWTGLVAKLLQQSHESVEEPRRSTKEESVMKAVAVFPGKAGSAHLAELPPSESPTSPVVAGCGWRCSASASTEPTGRSRTPSTARRRRARLPGPRPREPRPGRGGRPGVTELAPGDLAVAMVRRPGTSLYDAIGMQDFTTDDAVLRARHQPAARLPHRGVRGQRGLHRQAPAGLQGVGVLLEPMTVVEKGIGQAFEAQRRLRIWRPRRAAVLGAGTIGLMATLVLRLRGLAVDTFALTPSRT